MPAGRPRDQAPNGFVTTREAAEVLGISDQAVRARIRRGTLSGRVETLQNGEQRRYVHREELNAALAQSHEAATKNDAAELSVASALLASEVVEALVEEMRRLEGAMTRATGESGRAIVEKLNAINEQWERDTKDRRAAIKIVREISEENKAYRKRAEESLRGARQVLFAILACVVLLTIIAVVRLAVAPLF